jgi:tRNA(Arg) A34 adenosine deaminase TadA
MAFAIELARLNIRNKTGGPFGAAIFERDEGRLVAAGVNLVVSQHCSVAHAEIVAIMMAQKIQGTFDLSSPGLPALQLLSSAEPCAMCMGAIPWSGVRSLVCGARDSDARAAGFDEGHKPADWAAEFESKGIEVQLDVLRSEAAALFREYEQSGGPIYNPRHHS